MKTGTPASAVPDRTASAPRTTASPGGVQIASRLGIAERTVKAHLGNVFRLIGVGDRTIAALCARDHPVGE